MAHTRKRIFSLMMSGIMTASLLPAYLTQLSIPAAADDPPSSDDKPDTSPTIDFDYGNDPNNPILNADDALKDLGKQNKSRDYVQGVDAMKKNYSAYPWKHPDIIQEYNNGNEDDLRTMLESNKKEYIALSADIGDEWWKNGSDEEYAWNSIKITEDKVLDLNGHKITLDYYGNKNHHKDRPEQEYTWMDAHYLTAFEISEGATLTIIDSSEWRSASGTGRISFDAAEINHYDYNLRWYDHRDLFHVMDGNLIIYGGTYQAGDNKMLRVDESNFTWSKFKSAIGNAVELAVNVAEYTTGISEAKAAYVDVLQNVNAANTKVTAQAKSEPETQKNTPAEKNGGRNQSISEKALESDSKKTGQGASGEAQKANEKETAKNDRNTQLAKANSNIIKQTVNSSGIMGMVNSAFGLVDSIAGMLGTTSKPRITNSIKGTVVRVGTGGTFVSYGGHYIGNGSTPDTRNAVVEVMMTSFP